MKRTIFIISLIVIFSILIYNVLSKDTYEKDSPYDRIKESQIEIHNDKIIINVKNPSWSAYTDTNSMDPVLDTGANGLEIMAENEEDIHIGDIVAYNANEGLVVHRIVSIGHDPEWYALLKGDNNSDADPYKVRFNQIKYILIGVIY